MIEKTLTIPESILKAENMSYDNSNSGLNATDTQAAIDEINSKSNIKESTESPMLNTYDGVLKINEIGGVHEQFTTTGAQLFDASNLDKNNNDTLNVTDNGYTIVATGGTAAAYTYSTLSLDVELIRGKQVYLKCDELTGGSCQLVIRFEAAATQYCPIAPATTGLMNTTTIPEDAKSVDLQIYTNNTGTALTDTVTVTVRGLRLSFEECNWEPYTGGIASPNPAYPQEIKKTVATGVKTHGKNFIKLTVEDSTVTGVAITNNKETVTFKGTGTGSDGVYLSDIIRLTKGKYYTNVLCYRRDEKDQWLETIAADSVFDVVDESQIFRPLKWFNKDQVYDETITPMLCLAEYKDVVEPYIESSIEFSEPITLYGNPDAAVQDLLTTKQVERKYGEVVLDGSDVEGFIYEEATNRIHSTIIQDKAKIPSYNHDKANMWCDYLTNTTLDYIYHGVSDGICISMNGTMSLKFSEFTSLDDWKTHLTANPTTVTYELATPIIEPLPEVDQAALASLKTFDGITYVEFISEIQPTFKAEASATQEGSYVLDLLARTDSVEKQIEANSETIVTAQEDILDLEEAFYIPESTDTVLENSYPGLLKINEIGGVTEQFTTTGAQLLKITDGLNTAEAGVTAKDNGDGTFSLTGTTTGENGLFLLGYGFVGSDVAFTLKAGTYYVSGIPSSTGLFLYKTGDAVSTVKVDAPGGSFTLEEDTDFLSVSLRWGATDLTFNESAVRIMLNSGTEPLPWEPYTGGIASPNPEYPQEIKAVTGKNLLDCRGLEEKIHGGITYTPVYDENDNLLFIEANGTAIEKSFYYIINDFELATGNYIFNGYPSEQNIVGVEYYVVDSSLNIYGANTSKDTKFKSINNDKFSAFITILQNTTVSNLRFYPMIRKASIADPTYVPYGLLRVKTHGKNFANVKFDNGSIGGVTYALNADKSITVSGTREDASVYNVASAYLTKGIYTLGVAKGSFENMLCAISTPNGGFQTYGLPCIIEVTEENEGLYFIHLKGNITGEACSGTAYLQIEEGNAITDYEPYTESSMTFSQSFDLYGTDDVQDVITADGIERKYYDIKANALSGFDDSVIAGYIGLPNNVLIHTEWDQSYRNAMSNMSADILAFNTLNGNKTIQGLALVTASDGRNSIYFRITSIEQTEEAYNAFLAETPLEVVFELAEPTIEPLPAADQEALKSLLTYSDVTYVEFDCDGPSPTIKAEYPTSKENAYILESQLTSTASPSSAPAYDDTALQARITSVENQIDGFLSLDSTVVVKTDKFKCINENQIETTVVPAGGSLVASTYYDSKIYSTDGFRLYVSDLTTSAQYNITIQGQTTQITGIAVCSDTGGRICIHVVDSQARASCALYDSTITNNGQIDFAIRMSDVAAIYQDGNNIYLMDNGYRLFTTDSSAMGYNNIGMVASSLNLQTISWIKIFGDTLVVGGIDQMSNDMCELYDLSTGDPIEILVSETEAITLADVCYYEGGFIGVCTENGYFYRTECGKFYNPLVSTNSEASPMLWREFSMDVDTSYGVTMYVEGDYLVIYNSQSCYLFNSNGDNYYANTNMLVNVFSRDEGIYFVCSNDAMAALYETKEIPLVEAIMKIKL